MTRELVLIPGLNNTRMVWDAVVRGLPAGVRALAVDNPALDSVEAIAGALLPGLPERFWLAGFSFGGYVALALLQTVPHRIEGIALVCTSPYADPASARPRRLAALEAVDQGRYYEMIGQQAANAFHPDSLSDSALMQARSAMVQAYGPQRYAAHVRATMARPDRSGLLDGDKPTLVVTASHDTVITPESVVQYAAAIPGAQHHVVEGAGHLLPMEKPSELADILAEWMFAGSPAVA
jgi:pimeloyl-ACP methyl ester carboxylesterase